MLKAQLKRTMIKGKPTFIHSKACTTQFFTTTWVQLLSKAKLFLLDKDWIFLTIVDRPVRKL